MATVEKRGDNYRITASAGYNADGKQIRKTMTWKPAPNMTEKQIAKELERQKALFDDKVKNGQYLNGNIKFKDFAELWFRNYGKGTHVPPLCGAVRSNVCSHRPSAP